MEDALKEIIDPDIVLVTITSQIAKHEGKEDTETHEVPGNKIRLVISTVGSIFRSHKDHTIKGVINRMMEGLSKEEE